MSPPGDVNDFLVVARSALLDALDALADQRIALVLIGAQAIYLHTSDVSVGLGQVTKDSDLAIDPRLLTDSPLLDEAMMNGGFHRDLVSPQPGAWFSREGVPVDLMVPAALAGGGGRRGARIPPHDRRATRRAAGLEAAVVENSTMTVGSLTPDDPRTFEIRVAGPAALLVAKLHKLGERQEHPDRLIDKDAHDLYRLLLGTDLATLHMGLEKLRHDPLAGEVTDQAIAYLVELFAAGHNAPGSRMAGRAEEIVGDPAVVSATVSALAQDLVRALGVSGESGYPNLNVPSLAGSAVDSRHRGGSFCVRHTLGQMDSARWARPVALGVVRRGDELLVSAGHDSVKGEQFWRLLGGTIEFGELGSDAVVREFREELGIGMRVRAYLGTLENIFTWEGEQGHELVRVYELEPDDAALLVLDEWPVVESGGAPSASWKHPNDMDGRFYPHGIAELLREFADATADHGAQASVVWTLRTAEATDEEFLVELHRATMRDYVDAIWGWDDDAQARRHVIRLASVAPDQRRWVIEAGGNRIGMLEVSTCKQHVYVSAIEIAPEWQAKGIGTSIMRWINEKAARQQQPVLLRVLRSNPRARRLYEREGFHVVSETDSHVELRRDP